MCRARTLLQPGRAEQVKESETNTTATIMLMFPSGTHCTEKDVITKMGSCTAAKTQKTFYIMTNSVIELGKKNFFFLHVI